MRAQIQLFRPAIISSIPTMKPQISGGLIRRNSSIHSRSQVLGAVLFLARDSFQTRIGLIQLRTFTEDGRSSAIQVM
jgi:hypothetical protein